MSPQTVSGFPNFNPTKPVKNDSKPVAIDEKKPEAAAEEVKSLASEPATDTLEKTSDKTEEKEGKKTKEHKRHRGLERVGRGATWGAIAGLAGTVVSVIHSIRKKSFHKEFLKNNVGQDILDGSGMRRLIEVEDSIAKKLTDGLLFGGVLTALTTLVGTAVGGVCNIFKGIFGKKEK